MKETLDQDLEVKNQVSYFEETRVSKSRRIRIILLAFSDYDKSNAEV